MKIKIDKEGSLYIERGMLDWRVQFCPYTPMKNDGDFPRRCGDWCPLFDEPEPDEDHINSLEICGKTFYGEIIDERAK